LRHFDTLNLRLEGAGIPTRYRFKFLSPKNYPGFFAAVRGGTFAEWRPSLMQELGPSSRATT
jgi:hypothetical protein